MSTLREEVTIFLMRALLGEVFTELRSARFRIEGALVHVYFYVDGEPSAENLESISVAETELIACLDPSVEVISHVVRIDAPAVIPACSAVDAVAVFERKERD